MLASLCSEVPPEGKLSHTQSDTKCTRSFTEARTRVDQLSAAAAEVERAQHRDLYLHKLCIPRYLLRFSIQVTTG